MNKKVNLAERFALLEILPAEGNFATLKVVRKLRENLSLKEEELAEYEIKQGANNISWNPEKGKKEVEIEIGDFAQGLIRSKLKELNKDNKLIDRYLTLYEKFVEEDSDDKA